MVIDNDQWWPSWPLTHKNKFTQAYAYTQIHTNASIYSITHKCMHKVKFLWAHWFRNQNNAGWLNLFLKCGSLWAWGAGFHKSRSIPTWLQWEPANLSCVEEPPLFPPSLLPASFGSLYHHCQCTQPTRPNSKLRSNQLPSLKSAGKGLPRNVILEFFSVGHNSNVVDEEVPWIFLEIFLASGEPEKGTVSAMTVCRVDVMGSDMGSGI